MMQEIIASFTTVMTWVVLLLCLVVVVPLGLAAWHLPLNRRRALLGVVLMALVVFATGVGWLLLSEIAHSWSRLLLPFAAPVLLLSLYRLSFPPLVPGSARETRHQVLLLLLTMGALLAAGGVVLLNESIWRALPLIQASDRRRPESKSRTKKRQDLPTTLPGTPLMTLFDGSQRTSYHIFRKRVVPSFPPPPHPLKKRRGERATREQRNGKAREAFKDK